MFFNWNTLYIIFSFLCSFFVTDNIGVYWILHGYFKDMAIFMVKNLMSSLLNIIQNHQRMINLPRPKIFRSILFLRSLDKPKVKHMTFSVILNKTPYILYRSQKTPTFDKHDL